MRDGGTAGIAAGVEKELFLTLKLFDVGTPPPLLLLVQQVLELGCVLVRLQDTPAICFSQVGHHGVAPQGHQCLFVQRRLPPGRAVGIETTLGDEDVQMTIEVQMATEGMGDHQDHQPQAVCVAGPMLNGLGPQDRQVVEKMAVLPE